MGSKCVAVIEDEPDLLHMICDLLVISGYQIIAISHPDLIGGAIAASSPDLFLMNVMLRGRTGIEVAQQLRREGYTDTPIIAMSASPTMLAFARQSGMFQDEIDKPFDVEIVLHTIEHYLPLYGGPSLSDKY